MSSAIEARSLASLTDIANAPPTDLQTFRPDQHIVLILYITRVPGSRDVFLTPLKPRDRVVSAEDVRSSLYYIHMQHEEDVERLVYGSKSESQRGSNFESKSQWDEFKPRGQSVVRGNAELYSQQIHDAPVLPPRPTTQLAKVIPRKPVMTDITNTSTTAPPLPTRPRRPLPEIPKDEQHTPEKSDINLCVKPLTTDEEQCQSLLPFERPPCQDFQEWLTVIRREPSSGEQWNVAAIRDSARSDRKSSGTAARSVKRKGGSLELSICNPAYLIFATNNPDGCIPSTFTRQLHIEKDRSSLLMSESWQTHPLQASRKSVDSVISLPNSIDMRKKGYSFKSPWNGECEFTTTTSGKSLVCKHSIDGRSEEVSELRFNLPSSLQDTSSQDDRRKSYLKETRRSSKLESVRGILRSHDLDDMAETDPSFDFLSDMRLGQERAGGGFRGREPKLGKLIIQPSGLAMLDLIVTANIALWWRAWEKVS